MNDLNPIFEILHQAKAGQETIQELKNKPIASYLAVVSNIADPDDKRRIKVSQPHNPELETDWLRRLQPYGDVDPPLPEVGSTVLILSVDGVETNGWYLHCVNDTNPPKSKEDPALDHYEETKGKRFLEVAKDYVLKVVKDFTIKIVQNLLIDADGNITITAGRNITISNLAGANITLHEIGVASMSDNLGNTVVLGGATHGFGLPSDVVCNIQSGDFNFNLNGNAVKFNDAGNLTINTKSVATIGATTNDGKTVVTRGY